MSDDYIRTAILAEVTRRLAARGWTYIFSGLAGHPVGYGYTVGLAETFGHPEAVVVGLPQDVTAGLFADLVALIRAGERPQLDAHVNLGLNLPVVLRAVPAAVAVQHLWIAAAYYTGRRESFDAVQIVWPDARGRFPWEAGHQRAGNYQPLLSPGPPPE